MISLLTLFCIPIVGYHADSKIYAIVASQRGIASTYWPGDGQSGKIRSDGTRFTSSTCHVAHRDWPLGTRVLVCSESGTCVESYVGAIVYYPC